MGDQAAAGKRMASLGLKPLQTYEALSSAFTQVRLAMHQIRSLMKTVPQLARLARLHNAAVSEGLQRSA